MDTGVLSLGGKRLGLGVASFRRATYGNEANVDCKLTDGVAVRWKDREIMCQALVTSDDGEIVLGSLPLEYLDLIIDKDTNELVGAHGDEFVYLLMLSP